MTIGSLKFWYIIPSKEIRTALCTIGWWPKSVVKTPPPPDPHLILCVKLLIISGLISLNTYVLVTQKNRLIETVLLSTHNICLQVGLRTRGIMQNNQDQVIALTTRHFIRVSTRQNQNIEGQEKILGESGPLNFIMEHQNYIVPILMEESTSN